MTKCLARIVTPQLINIRGNQFNLISMTMLRSMESIRIVRAHVNTFKGV